MAGRPTEEQKNSIINIRISFRLLKHLKKYANTRDCSVSDYVRGLIEADYEQKSR